MILAYLGSQCTTFHTAGWTSWFVYPFIWSRVTGLTRVCDGSDSKCDLNLRQIRQTSQEESIRHARVLEWKSPTSLRLKKARQMKSKAESAHHSHQGDCSQRFSPGSPNIQSRILLLVNYNMYFMLWVDNADKYLTLNPFMSKTKWSKKMFFYLVHCALCNFSQLFVQPNGVHSALVRVNEELLEIKVAAPV
jgi:hypothetical protein